MDYIDPGCECDAPRFVDFTTMNSHFDDNADMWFDNHGDHGSINVKQKFEDDFNAVLHIESTSEEEGGAELSDDSQPSPVDNKSDEDQCNHEDTVKQESSGRLNTAKNLVGAVNYALKGVRRSPRVAAMKATSSISQMTKDSKKHVKSTEELQMEEIKRLQLEAKKRLRNSRRSYQKLAKSSKPIKVIKGSKPPTETKAFNFSKAAEKIHLPSAGGSRGVAEAVHPSNFASTLRTRHPSDQLDPPSYNLSSKKPPTPESVTKPKPFKFELDKRPGLRSNSINSKDDMPVAEFIAKYQAATPPRFRRTPTNSKPPASVGGTSCNYSLGSSITVPKTPNLLTKARARPVVHKSTAEVEEAEVAKMKQYHFKANPLNPDVIKMGGLLGVPRKRTNPNLTNPVSPRLATKKLALARKAQEGEVSEEMPDYEADRKFVAQPLPDFSEITGLPARKKRPATKPESPSIKKRRKLNETVEESTEDHVIKPTPLPNFDKVFVPQYPQRLVTPQPFSFEERDKNKDSRETLVQRILRDEQKSTTFKARPLPSSTFQPSQLPKVSSSVTMPEPFRLDTELRGEEHALKWREKVESQFEQEKKEAKFKASDASILYNKPFAPKKSTRPLTSVGNIVLSSEVRSSQRAKFDQEKLKRAHILEEENLQRRALREAEQAKDIAALRKTLIHKAQPIGYKVQSTGH